MHRHFADFDAFLAELVLDRAARLEVQAAALGDAAGSGTVANNLTDALISLFGPLAVVIVGLVISRDGLRARLHHAGAARIPLIAEGTTMFASYLAAERDLRRIAADADVDTLAPTIIGAAHLLFTDRESTPPDAAAVHKMVTTVIGGVVEGPPRRSRSSKHAPANRPAGIRLNRRAPACSGRTGARPSPPVPPNHRRHRLDRFGALKRNVTRTECRRSQVAPRYLTHGPRSLRSG